MWKFHTWNLNVEFHIWNIWYMKSLCGIETISYMKISYMKYLIYEIFMWNWNNFIYENFIYEIFHIWNISYMKYFIYEICFNSIYRFHIWNFHIWNVMWNFCKGGTACNTGTDSLSIYLAHSWSSFRRHDWQDKYLGHFPFPHLW
jgi:hypothetical protein